jgi:hypothetical protein
VRTNTVDMLLDERTRLITRNAATEGHLFMAEVHLRRAAKYLQAFIAPTPALAAARDTLVEEIVELLEEDRAHPATILSDSPETSALLGDAEAVPPHGDVEQGGIGY